MHLTALGRPFAAEPFFELCETPHVARYLVELLGVVSPLNDLL